jgi:predicted metalloprotease with PDZ domain
VASRYIDYEDVRRLRSYVELGSTVDAPAGAFGPCFVRQMVETPSFELGMDRTDLVEKHTMSKLKPGSQAEKSGLREGDRVIGTSVYWNDTSKPVKLTIQRGQARRTIEYYPHGRSRGAVPQYALDRERFEGNPQNCHPPAAIR